MNYQENLSKKQPGTLESNCEYCHKLFRSFASASRKYCSRYCYLEVHKATANTCVGCGSKFKKDGQPTQKYCSRYCYFSSKKPWNTGLTGVQPKLLGEQHPGIRKRMKELDVSWEGYNNWRDDKKRYYSEVWRVTNQQPLHTLSNYTELRGRAGVADAYQLDHIIAISEGFKYKIDPAVIGNIQNLQFIPWLDNLKKRNKN